MKPEDKNLDKLIKKIQHLDHSVIRNIGTQWSKDCANRMKKNYIANLEKQGRSDGKTPPLSSATLKMYDLNGEPDGSGIRDHIQVVTDKNDSKHFVRSAMVIADGKPTMIAKVQNNGVNIGVTERMRGFLATQGIFLKATTLVISIPPRYSLSRAVQQTNKEAIALLKIRLKKWLESNADN